MAGVCGLAGVWGPGAVAQSRVGPNPLGGAATPLPGEIDRVGIDQNLGNNLPLGTPLVDEQGRTVTLGDYFHQDKPVLIEFAYFDCPLLCPMIVSGIVEATRASNWVPGEQFEILTISINPEDGPEAALREKGEALNKLAQPDARGDVAAARVQAGAQRGWHFLTGTESDVKAIAAAAGFRYAAVPRTNDFAHAAAIMFVSPEGVIARYLPGQVYPVKDFNLALGEAAEGRQGSFFDMVLQLCYHYDATLGTYTADAMMLMKAAGALTVVVLGSVIGGMFYFERKRRLRMEADGYGDITASA